MPDFVDPYLDPRTGILRNLVGADTQHRLDDAETDLAAARLVELLESPPKPTGDLTELQAIHRHLFQDVYDWAGQLRRVDIAKNVDGAQHFLPWSRIETAAGYVFTELRDEQMLTGLDRDTFIDRFAHHYDQINYLHPFREGNGRTQRVLLSRIARDAGWQLNWQAVTGADNDTACRLAAENGDFTGLRDLLDRITTPSSAGRDEACGGPLRRLGCPSMKTVHRRTHPSQLRCAAALLDPAVIKDPNDERSGVGVRRYDGHHDQRRPADDCGPVRQ